MTLQDLFDELLNVIDETPPDQVAAVITHLAAAQSVAAARLVRDRSATAAADATEKERFLSVSEVVERFHVTARWLYRNKKHLPHSQPTRKTLLFPEAALTRWFAKRRT